MNLITKIMTIQIKQFVSHFSFNLLKMLNKTDGWLIAHNNLKSTNSRLQYFISLKVKAFHLKMKQQNPSNQTA